MRLGCAPSCEIAVRLEQSLPGGRVGVLRHSTRIRRRQNKRRLQAQRRVSHEALGILGLLRSHRHLDHHQHRRHRRRWHRRPRTHDLHAIRREECHRIK